MRSPAEEAPLAPEPPSFIMPQPGLLLEPPPFIMPPPGLLEPPSGVLELVQPTSAAVASALRQTTKTTLSVCRRMTPPFVEESLPASGRSQDRTSVGVLTEQAHPADGACWRQKPSA